MVIFAPLPSTRLCDFPDSDRAPARGEAFQYLQDSNAHLPGPESELDLSAHDDQPAAGCHLGHQLRGLSTPIPTPKRLSLVSRPMQLDLYALPVRY
jgi:hypothetical protein